MKFGIQFLALGIGIAIPGSILQAYKVGDAGISLYVPVVIFLSFFIYILFRKTQLIVFISQLFEGSYVSQLATLFTGALLLGTLSSALLLWFKSFTY